MSSVSGDYFSELLRAARNVPSRRRSLTDEDYLGWGKALDAREAVKPRTRAEVQRAISHINPVRFWQLKRDFKWLQKQMKKMGLNPEDARYIL